jgi:agmatinase
MSGKAPFAPEHRSLWSGLATSSRDAEIGILGVPFDGATTYRKGAAFAPEAIRALTPHVGPFTEEGSPLSGLRIRDYGDVPIDLDWERFFATIRDRAIPVLEHGFALFVGGDHSVTIPLASAFANAIPGPVGIVHVDAHLDLADEYDGHRWSHACTQRRVLELPNVAYRHLACVGIRSWMEEEASFAESHPEIGVYTARQLHRDGAEPVAQRVVGQLRDTSAVYVSCDIDGLDPSCAPGTGFPEAGGPSTRDIIQFLRAVFRGLPVRAMDVVEVAPSLDPTSITVSAAVRLIYEVFGWVHSRGA